MGDKNKKKAPKAKKNKLAVSNDQLGENAGEGRIMNEKQRVQNKAGGLGISPSPFFVYDRVKVW